MMPSSAARSSAGSGERAIVRLRKGVNDGAAEWGQADNRRLRGQEPRPLEIEHGRMRGRRQRAERHIQGRHIAGRHAGHVPRQMRRRAMAKQPHGVLRRHREYDVRGRQWLSTTQPNRRSRRPSATSISSAPAEVRTSTPAADRRRRADRPPASASRQRRSAPGVWRLASDARWRHRR